MFVFALTLLLAFIALMNGSNAFQISTAQLTNIRNDHSLTKILSTTLSTTTVLYGATSDTETTITNGEQKTTSLTEFISPMYQVCYYYPCYLF